MRFSVDRGLPLTFACSTAGKIAFQQLSGDMRSFVREPPFARGTGPLLLTDTTGVVKRLSDDVKSGEMVMLGSGLGPRPLGKTTHLALTRDRVYVGTADSASIDVYDLEGTRLPAVQLPPTSRPPSSRQYELALEAIVGNVRGPMAETLRKWFSGTPVVASLPPYSGILADSSGLIWVVVSFLGDSDTNLIAYNRSGHPVARVTLPVSMTVTEVGDDYVLGLFVSDDKTIEVGMYRLHRPR